jgi:hypothetical protein
VGAENPKVFSRKLALDRILRITENDHVCAAKNQCAPAMSEITSDGKGH